MCGRRAFESHRVQFLFVLFFLEWGRADGGEGRDEVKVTAIESSHLLAGDSKALTPSWTVQDRLCDWATNKDSNDIGRGGEGKHERTIPEAAGIGDEDRKDV